MCKFQEREITRLYFWKVAIRRGKNYSSSFAVKNFVKETFIRKMKKKIGPTH